MGWRNIIDFDLYVYGRIGWPISLKASAIRVEQIAFVGSPAPIPIKPLLSFFGTGGLGKINLSKSIMFFKSYFEPIFF